MVVSYTYCIVFCVLSSLCVWWCPTHIVLCFLFCPRYMYGGVLYILYCVFCFVLAMCMVVSYTYCIVFFVLSSLYVWWCPLHIVLCFMFCPRYVYGGVLHILYCVFALSSLCVWWCPMHIVLCFVFFTTIHITRTKQKTQYNMYRTPPYT
jgi:hypothetical protein